ncbi:MAG: hypothetical protein ACI9Y7_002092, partial [Dokdonia sp.]
MIRTILFILLGFLTTTGIAQNPSEKETIDT